MKRDFYDNIYKEHDAARSYIRYLPYDCANCAYMGRPSSLGMICGTCVLRKSNVRKPNNNLKSAAKLL